MATKELLIKNYKNLSSRNKDTNLILQRSNKLNEMGDLVILVGPNNAGKSNILNAVEDSLSLNALDKNVKPYFIYKDCPTTELSINYKGANPLSFSISTEHGRIYQIDKRIIDENIQDEFMDKISNARDILGKAIESNYAGKYLIDCFYHMADILTKTTSFDNLLNSLPDIEKTRRECVNFAKSRGYSTCGNYFYSYKSYLNVTDDEINSINWIFNDNLNETILKQLFIASFEQTYDYSPFFNVHIYKETQIANKDLTARYEEWENSPIIKTIFNRIGLEASEIENAYDFFKTSNNIGTLSMIKKKYQEKIELINAKFNQMYSSDKMKYKFDINFGTDMISLEITHGDIAVDLQRESTGFKWFFNLYFNYLFINDLKPGDILIMDEPATHLHIKGQEELRSFLKEFAIKTNITILIATHSPFLVSTDFLDELRVVYRDGKYSYIENNFCRANRPSHNTIYPIVKAFTTRSSVVVDTSKKIIFVEGITDYNYLVALKHRLKRSDFVFIPINGLGRSNESELKKTIVEIKKMRENPFILIDGDFAGDSFENLAKIDGIKTLKLTDIDSKFTEIENVFDDEDKSRYDINANNKHCNSSSVFKNNVIYNSLPLSKKTKDNFTSLFNMIDDKYNEK